MVFVITEKACLGPVILLRLWQGHTTLWTLQLDVEPSKQTLLMVNMEARCFVVSVAALRDYADILATVSNLIGMELETGPADAAFNLLGFR